ncbi:sialomucin core protein 24-like isoform X2 [Puntigrus tetrazona]|uniref:sialomucin core protein 24-like isoform X2 n=1 Tax=Puntigrus tetrazona TaxID=1606681 RepID=UPI001C8954D0|nr:sialomucin core protein 24-like isoform X2 [Puntigrus tetrazona]
MGVLTPQLLVCGQVILFLFVLNNITDAQRISGVSPSNLATTIAPPLNATGNHTKSVSNSSSYSVYNDTATQYNLTSPTTTSGPNQSNVTGSAVQPNTTANAQTTLSATSSTFNINSTAVTSADNSTRSTDGNATSSTSAMFTSNVATQNSSTSFNESQDGGLNNSEKSLTILFSILLGVIILVILGHFVYKFGRNKERSVQYTHRRLQNEDTGEPFAMPDDTLVISGGLYDGPQIYNPTMTVQNEEFQTDTSGFASRPTQFRLEFLREDQDRALDHETSTFQTFHAHDQEP